MGRRGSSPDTDDLDAELSLREAAHRYDVSVRTLRERVRRGRIPAYRTRGTRGPEWRVSGRSLEASGLRRRLPDPAGERDQRFARLQADFDALRRELTAERDRADEVDRRLGHALLECGRLRSALRQARRDPQARPDGQR